MNNRDCIDAATAAGLSLDVPDVWTLPEGDGHNSGRRADLVATLTGRR